MPSFHLQSVHDFVGDEISAVDGFRVVGFHATGSDFEDVHVVFSFVPRSQVLKRTFNNIKHAMRSIVFSKFRKYYQISFSIILIGIIANRGFRDLIIVSEWFVTFKTPLISWINYHISFKCRKNVKLFYFTQLIQYLTIVIVTCFFFF